MEKVSEIIVHLSETLVVGSRRDFEPQRHKDHKGNTKTFVFELQRSLGAQRSQRFFGVCWIVLVELGIARLWVLGRFGVLAPPLPCVLIVAFVVLMGVGSLWAQLVRVPWAQVALRWGDTWHPAMDCTSHGFVFQVARFCPVSLKLYCWYDERPERRWSRRLWAIQPTLLRGRIYTGTPASPCVLLTAQWEVRDIFQHHYSTGVLLMLSADRVIFWGNLGDFSWMEGIEWAIVSPLWGLVVV